MGKQLVAANSVNCNASIQQTIEFNGASVRMVLDAVGEPRFVAKDLVEAVGATWSGHSLDHIPEEYRSMESVSIEGLGSRSTVCLDESGMNFYLIRSDKPAALNLQKKISSEVLPAIRKTGAYMAKPLTNIQMLVLQAQAMADIEARQLAQEESVRALQAAELRRATAETDALGEIGSLPPASAEAPPTTEGQLTVSALTAWAFTHGGAYQAAYRMLYAAVYARDTRISLRDRMKNAKGKKRLSDVIDASGKAPQIYAIALELFAGK